MPLAVTMRNLLIAAALVCGFSAAAQAQVNGGVTAADIQRLQSSAAEAAKEISALGTRDAALKADLQRQLDEARDEITYLNVKLRRNEPTSHNEYTDLRDRIDKIRDRAHGQSAPVSTTPSPVTAAPPRTSTSPTDAASASNEDLPVGTEFDVRLQTALSSATAQVEDHFEGTTVGDLKQGDRIIVPAGSVVRGVVSSVKKAGRIERTGSLTVAFDQVTVSGRAYPIRATVTQAFESEGIRGDAGKIGAGAGVGAVIGAILGGAKGALAGILIGGGGTIAATEGKDVEIPPGTILRARLDTALSLR
jgi:hypothetical protein